MEPEEISARITVLLEDTETSYCTKLNFYGETATAVRECFRTWEAWQKASTETVLFDNTKTAAYVNGWRGALSYIKHQMSSKDIRPRLTEREALAKLVGCLLRNWRGTELESDLQALLDGLK